MRCFTCQILDAGGALLSPGASAAVMDDCTRCGVMRLAHSREHPHHLPLSGCKGFMSPAELSSAQEELLKIEQELR